MRNPVYIVLFLLFLCFVGCYGDDEVAEELIELTVAWTAEGCGGGNRRLAMDAANGVVYLTEVAEESLCAIDLNTGELLWRTDEEGHLFSKVNPVYDDKFVYTIGRLTETESEEDVELVFLQLDKMTGEVKTKREIGKGRGVFPRGVSLTLHEGILYWGAQDRHFVYSLDTRVAESVPEICYGSADETADILGDIVPYQGRLYFFCGEFPYKGERDPMRLVSIDLEGNILRKNEYSSYFSILSSNCLQFFSQKLYCYGKRVQRLNPETLELEWELIQDWGSWSGFTIYEEKIYAANTGNFVNYAVCIDTNTGKQLWKTDLDSGFYGTIAYTPQVYEGYLYLPTQASVIVLDAKTGKFIGRDESLQTGFLSEGITERYNDLMIFETMYDRIYAVKMDLHERQLGGKE